MRLRQVCAWCGTELNGTGEPALEDCPISHGICHDCLQREFNRMGMPLQALLEHFAQPIAVVNVDGRVLHINGAAEKLLGKPSPQAAQHLGGEVFDCIYSVLPGGCGKTIHCSGCTIRQSVERTHATGEPQRRIPATLRRTNDGEPEVASLLITTEKLGELVLLRVDRFEPGTIPAELESQAAQAAG
jgi:PAS domain-containing protein